MDPAASRTGPALYPEREDAPQSQADRFVATLCFRYHNRFHRVRRDAPGFADEVRRRAMRFATEPLLRHLPELRYRLRRDGIRPDGIAECLALGCAALSPGAVNFPAPDALAAATILLQGGIAELADRDARQQALILAAITRVIEGVPAHIFAASDTGAVRMAEALRAPLAALGMEAGCVVQGMDARARRTTYSAPVVCGTQREIAIDYLRDRLLHGGKPRPLASLFERLSDSSAGAKPMLGGLHCALVDEADAVLLDDAHLPLAIAAEADQSAERLLYEQALELARALARDADYKLKDEGAQLTEEGAQRVARLISPLGGVWAARQRREELISLALEVLHQFRPGVDYRVEQGRVSLRAREEAGEEPPSEEETMLLHLIEIKEGCRLSGRRDVLVRLSGPRFFRRYLRLAGVSAEAGGFEREFWAMYSLATTRVGGPAATIAAVPRVFMTSAGKRSALVARVQSAVADGARAVIAIRTPAEAQAVAQALEECGLQAGLVNSAGVPSEVQQALARLEMAGGIVMVLYPGDRRIGASGDARMRTRLFVAELHDAWRHVARLARTVAADSCEVLLAVEDETIARLVPPAIRLVAQAGGTAGDEFSSRWSRWLSRLAQHGIERTYTTMRQDLLSRDLYLDDLLAFSGKRE